MHAAFDLARAQHGVDGPPDVVRGHYPLQAPFVVEDDDLGGVAERHVRDRVRHVGTRLGRKVTHVLTVVLAARQTGQSDRFACAWGEIGGQLLRRDPSGSGEQGRSPGRRRHPADDPRVTGRSDVHGIHGESGLLVHDLAKHGEQALAHLGVAGQDLEPSVLSHVEEHTSGIVHPVPDARVLDAAADAGVCGFLVDVTHGLQRLTDAAAVRHHLAGRESVARGEDVALADVVAVDPHFLGQEIHDAFDGEGCLVRPETAHRPARRVVRVDRSGLDVHGRHPVRAARVTRGSLQHLHAHGRVGSRVPCDPGPHGRETPLGVRPCPIPERDGVALRVHPKGLLAREDRADRPTRQERRQGRLGLDRKVFLASEGSSVADELYLDGFGIDPENGSHLGLVVVHALALREDLEAVASSLCVRTVQGSAGRDGQARFRLEKGVLDALRHESAFHDVSGSGQGRVHVTTRVRAHVEQVAAFMYGRRSLAEGFDRVGHGFHHLIAHRFLQRFGGQLRVEPGVGQDEGQDVTHTAGGLALCHEDGPVLSDQAHEPTSRNIFGRQDPLDPGRFKYGRCVDLEDDGARVPAQHHGAVKHAIDRQVGHVGLVAKGLLGAPVPQAVASDPAALAGRPSVEAPGAAEHVRSSRATVLRQGLCLPGVGHREHGVHDPLIAGAAADMAGERLPDLVLVHGRRPIEQRNDSRGDSGRAIAALESSLTNEGLRQDAALAFRQALEGGDRLTLHGLRLPKTAQDGPTFHHHRAAPTCALRGATVLGRRHAALVPQHIEQVHPLLVRDASGLAVQLEGQLRHGLRRFR